WLTLVVVSALAVLADVQAFAFHLFGDTQTVEGLGDVEGDGRTDCCPNHGKHGCVNLHTKLSANRVVCTSRTAKGCRVGESHTDRTDDASNTVDAEDVSGIVKAELRLGVGDEGVGHNRG